MSCCYLPSQLHACLLCLALPCLAMPCLFLLFPCLFFLSIFSSSIPLEDEWKNDQVPSMFCNSKFAFGSPPNIRESVCFVAWFSLSRKKKPLLPALHSGIEPV